MIEVEIRPKRKSNCFKMKFKSLSHLAKWLYDHRGTRHRDVSFNHVWEQLNRPQRRILISKYSAIYLKEHPNEGMVEVYESTM